MSTTKLESANQALECFAEGTRLDLVTGQGVVVTWKQSSGKLMSRRWATCGQSFYPTWHYHWGHGGTATTALAQLVRWIRGQPVLPMATWRMWVGDRCQLARSRDFECLQALRDGGYPEVANCVLCEQPITGGMDWWYLDKVSGPCCSMHSGCKQKGKGGTE